MYVPLSSVIFQICAYCGKYKGAINGYGISGVSHGICAACSEREISQYKERTVQNGTGKAGL